jgi:hypothetical protein
MERNCGVPSRRENKHAARRAVAGVETVVKTTHDDTAALLIAIFASRSDRNGGK